MLSLKDYNKLISYIQEGKQGEHLNVKSVDGEKWLGFYIRDNNQLALRIFDFVDGYELSYIFINKNILTDGYNEAMDTIDYIWRFAKNSVEL